MYCTYVHTYQREYVMSAISSSLSTHFGHTHADNPTKEKLFCYDDRDNHCNCGVGRKFEEKVDFNAKTAQETRKSQIM